MNDPTLEAQRWWAQALDDLAFVEWVQQEDRFHDKACFMAQQAAEKALKACRYALGERIVTGHSTLELLKRLEKEQGNFEKFMDCCRRLDRFYIPTRYPNGLPGGVPASMFTRADVHQAIEDCRQIIRAVGAWLVNRKVLEQYPQ